MRAIEHQEQVHVINWFALMAPNNSFDPKLLFAIPNGGRRDRVSGAKLKEEGVRAGVPDLFLAIPVGCHHGMFIELKQSQRGRSKVSPMQHEMMERLSGQGYHCVIGWGADDAIDKIERYLKGWETSVEDGQLVAAHPWPQGAR